MKCVNVESALNQQVPLHGDMQTLMGTLGEEAGQTACEPLTPVVWWGVPGVLLLLSQLYTLVI